MQETKANMKTQTKKQKKKKFKEVCIFFYMLYNFRAINKK